MGLEWIGRSLLKLGIGAAALGLFLIGAAQQVAEADSRIASAVFGAARSPSILPARSIGSYSRGCLSGARALPPRGETWQTMRPSRNRAWGHPITIAFVEDLAAAAPSLGLNGILVGDISQPIGGPMPYGHSSHQIGLDADIWLTEMPAEPLSEQARETLPFTSMIGEDGWADPSLLTPAFHSLIKTAARDARVARIFVNPVIKRALCDAAGTDRSWLRRVRPWYGHDKHFHVRLNCPPTSPDCRAQRPPPVGDGCGAPLDYWFTAEPYKPKQRTRSSGPMRVNSLPGICGKLVRQIAVPAPRPRPRPHGAVR